MFAGPETAYDQAWYPDSGASNHVTPEPNNLMQRMIIMGLNMFMLEMVRFLKLSMLVILWLKCPFNLNLSLTLKNLLHVPQIVRNLVTVSKPAKDNHVFFEFNPHSCFFKSQLPRKYSWKGNSKMKGFTTSLAFLFSINITLILPLQVFL